MKNVTDSVDSSSSKKRGLDVFEFDEDDDLVDNRFMKDANDGKYRWTGLYRKVGDQIESQNGGTSRSEVNDDDDDDDDECDLPLSVLRKKYRVGKAVRLQGKNGVLKVQVDKDKNMGVLRSSCDRREDYGRKDKKLKVVHQKMRDGDDRDGRSESCEDSKKNKLEMKCVENEVSVKKNKSEMKSVENEGSVKKFKSEMKSVENEGSVKKNKSEMQSVENEGSVKKKRSEMKPVENEGSVKKKKSEMKSVEDEGSVKKNKSEKKSVENEDSVKKNKLEIKSVENEGNVRKNKLEMKSVENGRFVKKKKETNSVKSKGIAKKISKIKEKEMQVKSGSGTEKQILREKIKDMLVAGGWTIDYRPRKGRNYMDSVYISPSGTGYWSIIKAYDAFQKEKEDDFENGSGKFTPLRNEIVSKLSRQSHSEPEYEMKTYSRRSRKIGRCSLLVREYDNKKENGRIGDGFVPYPGKRTLLSWLVDSGVVHLREHVEYTNNRKTRVLQKGWITTDGIHCSCCSKIVTVAKFEAHAGSKVRQPFLNIFLESGKSLMQCQIDAWNKLGELERKGFYSVDVDGDDPNDDTCGLCGDGGDLICCDCCPSTFHQTCLELPMLPQGDYVCPNCTCKYCEKTYTDATQDSLLTCYLCQKKYHESCSPETDVKPSESDYPNMSFCEHTCHELYSQLQKLVGVKQELGSGFSWSLIHRSELPKDASSVESSQRVECNSMLAVAMSVMDECFLPFTDRRTGANLMRNVVFNCGSNLSRLNYSSFFTAILERGDEVICAASIRIHGTQLAEMPFIGTRHLYRRQGMCRRLLSAIEAALSSLQVEKLIIPAVPEHMDTWTDVFGFRPLEESDKQHFKCMNMVVFPKTDMLQKSLVKAMTDSGSQELKHSVSEDEAITAQVANASDSPCEPERTDMLQKPLVKAKTDSGSQEPKHLVSVDEAITAKVANASDSRREPEGTDMLQKPLVKAKTDSVSQEPKLLVSEDEAVTAQVANASDNPCEPEGTDMLQKPLVKAKTDSGSQEPKHSVSEDEAITVQAANASDSPCEPEGTDMLQKPLVKAKTDYGSQEPKRSVSEDEATAQVANASDSPCEIEGMESVSIETSS